MNPRSPPCAAEPGSCEFSLASSANRAGARRACAARSSAFFLAAAFSSSLASGLTAIRMWLACRSSALAYCLRLLSYCLRTSAGSTLTSEPSASGVKTTYSIFACSGVWNAAWLAVVEGLDRGVVDFHVLAKRVGADDRIRDLALLVEQSEITLDVALGDDAGSGDRFLQRRLNQRPAHVVDELRRGLRRILHCQQLLVALRREFAVDLERGDLADVLPHLVVRDPKLVAARLIFEQPLADQLLERGIAHFGIIEYRRGRNSHPATAASCPADRGSRWRTPPA